MNDRDKIAMLEADIGELKRRLLQLETDIIGDCIQLGKRWWVLLCRHEPEEAERLAWKPEGGG
ncbi:MAG: hypothetical protein V4529_16545 [Gemmatimonadota bacterium]